MNATWIFMTDPLRELAKASAAIERATLNRDAAIAMAFQLLDEYRPALAQALVAHFGDRRRAARWMCLHQESFAGRNAYDMLVKGEDDRVWAEILH
jgi:hypothetical protein